MGVDFFPCDYCGDAICDCGGYERCECGRRWCDRACAAGDGYGDGCDEDGDRVGDPSCKFCRLEDAADGELLHYLLRQYNVTRAEVLEGWRNERRGEVDDPADAD